jgi:tetratricopeptide (TPR) repeat protein
VVRYRSDLAVSLNNLGVAYCRAAKPGEADTAFKQARELFAELASDYPDQLSYRSSLAAQLNNQALALADAGRHAEAISTYREAIDAQVICNDRAPDSATMRDLLSKMYYNFGQSLRVEKQWGEAVDVALTRRKLWQSNGERLLGVAVELAELDQAVLKQAGGVPDKDAQARIEDEVLTTLRSAYNLEGTRKIDIDAEPKYVCFKSNDRFAKEISALNERLAQVESSSESAASPKAN